MTQTVTVNLVVAQHLPAALERHLRDFDGRRAAAEKAAAKGDGPAPIVRTYDEQLRDISESLIVGAIRSVYGDNIPKTERGMWRRLQDQLIDDAHVLTMDGTAYEWLERTLKSDKVKVHPDDTTKWETFIESLATIQRVADAG